MNKPLSALSRRQFIVGATGSSLVLGLGSSLGGCQPDQAASDLATTGGSDVFSPVVWFEIDSAGAILMNIVRAEMGQHVGTALAVVPPRLPRNGPSAVVPAMTRNASWKRSSNVPPSWRP